MPIARNRKDPEGDVHKLLPALKACFTEAEDSCVPSRSIGHAIREYDPNISWEDCKTQAWGRSIRQAFPRADNKYQVAINGTEYAAWFGIKPTSLAPGNWEKTNEDTDLIYFSSLADEPHQPTDYPEKLTKDANATRGKMPTWEKWAWWISFIPFIGLPAIGYMALSIPGWVNPEWKQPTELKWAIGYGGLLIATVVSILTTLTTPG